MEEKSNPYQSPDSNIYLTRIPKRSKNVWKIFFAISLLLYIIGLFFTLDLIYQDPFVSTLDLVIYTLLIVGLYGFAFDKKVFFRGFWIVLLISSLGIEAYDYFENGFLVSGADADGLFFYLLFFSTLMLTISLLQYFVIYQYAFNSDAIWNQLNQSE